MAQLKSSRASDSDYIGQTDDFFGEIETDIADILGVGLDHTISSPIFAGQTNSDGGSSGAGGGQVNGDGTITGILQFLSTTTTKTAAAGIEFECTGGNRYKIAATADNLEVMEWDSDNEQWDLIGNLNVTGTILSLTDCPDEYGTEGQVLAMNAAEDALEFVDVASGSIATLEEIGDVPEYEDGYLKSASGTLAWAAGSGEGATTFGELTDCTGDPTSSLAQRGRAEVVYDGISAYRLALQPCVIAYGVGRCLNDTAGLINPPSNMNIPVHGRYMYFDTSDSNSRWNVSDQVFKDLTGTQNHSDTISVPTHLSGVYLCFLTLKVEDWADNSFYVSIETIQGNIQFPAEHMTFSPPMQLYDDNWRPCLNETFQIVTQQFLMYKPEDGGTADRFRMKIKQAAQGGSGEAAVLAPYGSGGFTLSMIRLG